MLDILHRLSQLSVAGPVPDALWFFVMNPEYVTGNDVEPGRLRFIQSIAPFIARNSAEVKFPRNGQPGFTIPEEVHTVEVE